MKEIRYIAVEGAIGVGKTTLARLLADRLQGRLVLEKHDDNPFLADFYKDPARYAFQTQLFFLFSRFRQQKEFQQMDVFHPVVISDYIFAKDRIFAYLNLADRELQLYDQIYQTLGKNAPRPDLVIYLQTSVQRLMQNIHKRGRSYEKYITEEYIRSLSEAYNHFFFHYQDSPLLVVNSSKLNFADQERDLATLLGQIDRHPGGIVFLNPDVT